MTKDFQGFSFECFWLGAGAGSIQPVGVLRSYLLPVVSRAPPGKPRPFDAIADALGFSLEEMLPTTFSMSC